MRKNQATNTNLLLKEVDKCEIEGHVTLGCLKLSSNKLSGL